MRQWTAKKLESEEGKIKSMACAVLTNGSNFFYRQLFTLFCQEMLGVCENADKPKRKFVMISITVYYLFFFFFNSFSVKNSSCVLLLNSRDGVSLCITRPSVQINNVYIIHLPSFKFKMFYLFLGFTDISYFENQRN